MGGTNMSLASINAPMIPPAESQRIWLSLLVLQGSPFCNIDCDYCYLPNRSVTRRMPMEVLAKTMERLCEAELIGPPFDVLWHAGEPLAVPVSYYEQGIEVINRFPPARGNASFVFQTNAMLIDQAWCDFFKSHKADVGVSVDGPAFIHDAHRKTRSGEGSHAKAMAGIRKLQENEIKFGVITVITEDALNHPDEIFEFLEGLNCSSVGFNIEEIEGANQSTSLSVEGGEFRLRKFLRRFYELNRRNGFPLRVREFDDARQRLLDPSCYFNNESQPLSMLNVDCDGNFSTFSPEMLGQSSETYGDFAFGNVMRDRIFDALQDPGFQKVAADIDAGNQKCAETCYYFPYCQGASPTNKYFENKTFDSTETMHCRSVIQTPVDIVRQDMYRHGQWPQKSAS